MNVPSNDILLALIASSSEPLIVARVDHPDWPVVLSNDAFRELIKGAEHETKPLADVIERLLDRELALEVSEVVRAGQRSTIPVEVSGREVMLSLVPLQSDSPSGGGRYYAAYWRAANANHQDVQQALAQANRRLRDLSREDPTTGLLNGSAFRDVLEHDWAVAAREQTTLSIVAFGFDDFRAYLDVFGRHATDTSLRRIAQVIRRALRRASDLAAWHDGPNGGHVVVLSHGSNEAGTQEFAVSIAAAVRELGLHHPRSRVSKFVTVSFGIAVANPADRSCSAAEFLESALSAEEIPAAATG